MVAAGQSRRYPRVKSPKGLHVAWCSTTQRSVSRAETLGLGGLFLHAAESPAVGTIIQLLIDIPGVGVRARAIVRSRQPGKGMGVEIVSMRPEDRARLSKLFKQLQA